MAALGSQLVLLSREAWRTANSPAVGVEGSEAIGGKGAVALVKMHALGRGRGCSPEMVLVGLETMLV
jgi:hypothetical protein